MSGLDEKGLEWPERLTLRDTKVIADEGQRIFTTATGYGYEKREYVRADLASATPADVGEEPVAWRWRPQGGTVWVVWEAKPMLGGNLVEDAVVEIEPIYSATALERVVRERDEALWFERVLGVASELFRMKKPLSDGLLRTFVPSNVVADVPGLIAKVLRAASPFIDRAESAEAKLAEARNLVERFSNGGVDVSGTAIIVGYPEAKALWTDARRFLDETK